MRTVAREHIVSNHNDRRVGRLEHYTYLLPETDARTSVEWKKDERVRGEIFVQPFVDPPVGVEVLSCRPRVSNPEAGERPGDIPSGPQ